MAIGGPEPTPLDLREPRMPSAPPSVTGLTDAQIGQQNADFAGSYDPNSGLPGMMSQDRVPVQQAMEEPLAPEQKALAQAERTISARDFLSGGGGRGIRDAQYAPTQQDLYPQQNDVLIGQTRGVGKYGRAPIFYGGNNILPLGVVGGKMKAIADERKKLEDAAKGLNLTEGLEKLNNPNYEAVRNQWVRDSIQSEYAKFRDFYGDDVELRAALNTPGTAAHRAFYGPGGVIDSINTVSKQANQIFAETEAVIEGMTGPEAEMEMDEDLLNRAYAVREGLQGNGDIRKLAKDWRSLQAVLNVDRFVKDNKLTELYEKAVKESTKTTGPTTIHIRGGRVVKFDKNTSSEQIREQLVDAVASNPAFRGQVSRERVEKLFPLYEKTEVDWKLMQDRAPKGSKSSGAQGAAPKYSIIASAEPQFNTSDVWSGKPKEAVPTLTISEDVGGKNRPLGTLVFEDQNQVPIRVAGARLQKRGNEWVTVGMEIDNRYIDQYKKALEDFDGDTELAAQEMSRLNMAKPIEIPYKMHAGRWKGYFNDPNFDPDRAYQQQSQQQKYVKGYTQKGSDGNTYEFIGGDPKQQSNWIKK